MRQRSSRVLKVRFPLFGQVGLDLRLVSDGPIRTLNYLYDGGVERFPQDTLDDPRRLTDARISADSSRRSSALLTSLRVAMSSQRVRVFSSDGS
jgi:hypothetical protein